ncbi:MAG: sialidase family protein, partial [Bacteroidota bacterium]
MKTSLKLTLLFLLNSVFVSAQYQNILIGNNFAPNEPSIMINPKNPNQVVAGANIDNYYYSNDGGWTWLQGTLSSSYGVWGDPVIGVDTAGSFYFFHLSMPPYPGTWIDRIVCQKSTNGGATWSDGTFTGLNGSKAQDKHWVAIDRANNNIYLTWTQFDEYAPVPPNPNDSSVILFSRSLDGGNSWSTAKRINKVSGDCEDSDNTVEGAVPAVGPNGEGYVS